MKGTPNAFRFCPAADARPLDATHDAQRTLLRLRDAGGILSVSTESSQSALYEALWRARLVVRTAPYPDGTCLYSITAAGWARAGAATPATYPSAEPSLFP